MIRRALIPLDGSKLAEQVIPHLLRFITPDQTELLLMTALSSALSPDVNNPNPPISRLTAPSKEYKAYEQLHKLTQKLNQIGFSVMDRFLSDVPAKSILALAEQTLVDLIAMSTHGRTGLRRVLMGSVADEVVCHARPPIFLTPATLTVKPESAPRTILLPLDGTPLAEAAIPIAQQFAQNTGATLCLIRTIESNYSEYEQQANQAVTVEQTVIQQATSYLEQIQLRLQLANVASCYQIASGDPATAIIRAMHMEKADLVVMSTHGRSGMERIIHGSVTRKIIGKTICPLVLIRGIIPIEIYEPDHNRVFTAYSR